MPLEAGWSEEVVHKNIGEMVASGRHSSAQAAAAAFGEARREYRRHHPRGPLPEYLRKDNRGANHAAGTLNRVGRRHVRVDYVARFPTSEWARSFVETAARDAADEGLPTVARIKPGRVATVQIHDLPPKTVRAMVEEVVKRHHGVITDDLVSGLGRLPAAPAKWTTRKHWPES